MSDIKQKARDEQYCAFLADIIEKHQRPRPDGSIDWNKAFGQLLELRNKYIDLAIKEREGEIVEMIKSKGIFVGENRHLNKYIHEIINLITNSKE